MTYYFRGNAYRRFGNLDLATKDLTKAVQIDPTYKHSYIDLGLVKRKLGKYSQAIENYNRALEIDPKFAKAYYNRGNVYWWLKQYNRATEDYDRATALDSEYFFPFIGRAWTKYAMGRDADALSEADMALSLHPGNEDARYIRALILGASGHWQEALEELDDLLDAGESHTVETVQEALVSVGQFDGPIDGKYGPKTRNALMNCLKSRCRLLE